MRRWVCLFLLVLLPLQLSWAAAAGYCRHESGPGTVAHFGHHQHHHVPSAGEPAGGEASRDGGHATKLPGVDHDCPYCQLGSSQAVHVSFALGDMPVDERYAGSPPVSKPCFIASRVDRPDWRAA